MPFRREASRTKSMVSLRMTAPIGALEVIFTLWPHVNVFLRKYFLKNGFFRYYLLFWTNHQPVLETT